MLPLLALLNDEPDVRDSEGTGGSRGSSHRRASSDFQACELTGERIRSGTRWSRILPPSRRKTRRWCTSAGRALSPSRKGPKTRGAPKSLATRASRHPEGWPQCGRMAMGHSTRLLEASVPEAHRPCARSQREAGGWLSGRRLTSWPGTTPTRSTPNSVRFSEMWDLDLTSLPGVQVFVFGWFDEDNSQEGGGR
jgi:hypothetical protein